MTIHTDEEYEALRQRNNTYAESNMKMAATMDQLRSELHQTTLKLNRAEAQLAAEQSTMSAVVTDNNSRYRGMETEILRLRKLLEDNGISPEE